MYLWLTFTVIIQLTFANHICDKIRNGQFNQINFKSFTQVRNGYFLIYESDKLYVIPNVTTKNDLNQQISLPNYFDAWNEGLKDIIGDMKDSEMFKSISFIIVNIKVEGWFDSNDISLMIANMIYDRTMITSVPTLQNEPKRILWKKDLNGQPLYQIISELKLNFVTKGLVASYEPTIGFIIYPLKNKLHKTFKMDINIPPDINETNIFTLKRNDDNINQVHVQRTSRTVKTSTTNQKSIHDKQLFTNVPTGFVNGKSVVLFDNNLHCVYIISDLMETITEFNGQDNVTLNRKNIPYEQYFNCEQMGNGPPQINHPLGFDRCQMIFKPTDGKEIDDDEIEPETTSSIQKRIIYGCIGFIIFLLCILLDGTRPRHLCRKIRAGQFDEIDFKSFTFEPTLNKLFIYESNRRYCISDSYGRNEWNDQMVLPDHSENWNTDLELITEEMTNPKLLRTISFIKDEKNIRNWLTSDFVKKNYVNFVYDQANILLEFKPNKMLSEKDWSMKQPFHIISKSEFNHYEYGMVVSREPSIGFIFYPLKFDLIVLHRIYIPTNLSAGNIFTLERIDDDVDQVRLRNIHAGKINHKDQLFQNIPLGFVNNRSTILFDTKLHCVYIISHMLSTIKISDFVPNLDGDNTLERKSIPYEIYFNCDEISKDHGLPPQVNHPLGIERCVGKFLSTNTNNETIVDSPILSYKIIIILISFISIVIFVWILRLCQNKKTKKNKNKKERKTKKKPKESIQPISQYSRQQILSETSQGNESKKVSTIPNVAPSTTVRSILTNN